MTKYLSEKNRKKMGGLLPPALLTPGSTKCGHIILETTAITCQIAFLKFYFRVKQENGGKFILER